MKASKNLFILLLSLALCATFFISCDRNDPEPEEPLYVLINGVRWATRNVAAPGTFAANPEDFGMHFQWNRRTGWSPVGDVNGWDSSISEADTWERENDPCPPGWRVPTNAEFISLVQSPNFRTSRNGVIGQHFGAFPNTIFLPAAGVRSAYDGVSVGVGENGAYWSSSSGTGSFADISRALLFFRSSLPTAVGHFNRAHGASIRCVAEYNPRPPR